MPALRWWLSRSVRSAPVTIPDERVAASGGGATPIACVAIRFGGRATVPAYAAKGMLNGRMMSATGPRGWHLPRLCVHDLVSAANRAAYSSAGKDSASRISELVRTYLELEEA